MASWICNFLLNNTDQKPSRQLIYKFIFGSLLTLQSASLIADDGQFKENFKVDSERFDIGIALGFINIEDFPSEFITGITANFRASEDYFIQYNYVQTSVSESSFENAPGTPTFNLSDDRAFKHYDLLLGRNVFQGEFFTANNRANLSTLYILGGIGDTNFGGEKNFTYTVGIGYQLEFFDWLIVSIDYRSYLYKSSLIVGEEEDTAHNTQFSGGLRYLF